MSISGRTPIGQLLLLVSQKLGVDCTMYVSTFKRELYRTFQDLVDDDEWHRFNNSRAFNIPVPTKVIAMLKKWVSIGKRQLIAKQKQRQQQLAHQRQQQISKQAKPQSEQNHEYEHCQQLKTQQRQRFQQQQRRRQKQQQGSLPRHSQGQARVQHQPPPQQLQSTSSANKLEKKSLLNPSAAPFVAGSAGKSRLDAGRYMTSPLHCLRRELQLSSPSSVTDVLHSFDSTLRMQLLEGQKMTCVFAGKKGGRAVVRELTIKYLPPETAKSMAGAEPNQSNLGRLAWIAHSTDFSDPEALEKFSFPIHSVSSIMWGKHTKAFLHFDGGEISYPHTHCFTVVCSDMRHLNMVAPDYSSVRAWIKLVASLLAIPPPGPPHSWRRTFLTHDGFRTHCRVITTPANQVPRDVGKGSGNELSWSTPRLEASRETTPSERKGGLVGVDLGAGDVVSPTLVPLQLPLYTGSATPLTSGNGNSSSQQHTPYHKLLRTRVGDYNGLGVRQSSDVSSIASTWTQMLESLERNSTASRLHSVSRNSLSRTYSSSRGGVDGTSEISRRRTPGGSSKGGGSSNGEWTKSWQRVLHDSREMSETRQDKPGDAQDATPTGKPASTKESKSAGEGKGSASSSALLHPGGSSGGMHRVLSQTSVENLLSPFSAPEGAAGLPPCMKLILKLGKGRYGAVYSAYYSGSPNLPVEAVDKSTGRMKLQAVGGGMPAIVAIKVVDLDSHMLNTFARWFQKKLNKKMRQAARIAARNRQLPRQSGRAAPGNESRGEDEAPSAPDEKGEKLMLRRPSSRRADKSDGWGSAEETDGGSGGSAEAADSENQTVLQRAERRSSLRQRREAAQKSYSFSQLAHLLCEEIAALRKCQSDHVIRYETALFRAKAKQIWIVLEYCAGGSLVDIMAVCDVLLTERETAAVLRQALLGLHALHSRRHIHRDVKAGNILVSADGICKLADFGVAARVSGSAPTRKTVIGSPYWMSPEVLASDQGYSYQADIWSLAITAIELSCGAPPYFDLAPVDAIRVIPHSAPPTIPAEKKHLFSTEFHNFLARCLVKDPSKRPTAGELLRTDPFILRAGGPEVLRDMLKRCLPQVEAYRRLETRIDQTHGLAGLARKAAGPAGSAIGDSSYDDSSSRSNTPRSGGDGSGGGIWGSDYPPEMEQVMNAGAPQVSSSQAPGYGPYPPQSAPRARQPHSHRQLPQPAPISTVGLRGAGGGVRQLSPTARLGHRGGKPTVLPIASNNATRTHHGFPVPQPHSPTSPRDGNGGGSHRPQHYSGSAPRPPTLVGRNPTTDGNYPNTQKNQRQQKKADAQRRLSGSRNRLNNVVQALNEADWD